MERCFYRGRDSPSVINGNKNPIDDHHANADVDLEEERQKQKTKRSTQKRCNSGCNQWPGLATFLHSSFFILKKQQFQCNCIHNHRERSSPRPPLRFSSNQPPRPPPPLDDDRQPKLRQLTDRSSWLKRFSCFNTFHLLIISSSLHQTKLVEREIAD